MLQIKNISKQYKTGDLVQHALNDVSLNLRDNEFVSILGPSGSGKTTLLNIIGGLDRYDSGDLIINNVSTKDYEDRDWDSYRNHTIGFVFQSYNLIPHQTVLANVELALTIGGISKKERKKRALEALDEVGLKEQAHKKPNQMSGGQMQRVAIARALVNNPDILLADEPTGALDTETSVQVMELLKKVAHDRLVIMVTHNPELAEEYSTRIVRLKDGKIIDDTDPFVLQEETLQLPEYKNLGKASMSPLTALSLSFNNLLTKKGRTILTAFAGSIGIIGIALILSLSTGFQNYIDKIQEDTLTSYPLTITSETADMTSALLSMVAQSGESSGDDIVRERKYMSTMFAEIGTNDLHSLKAYLEDHKEEVEENVSLVRYQYSVVPMIYTIDSKEEITQLNPSTMLSTLSGGNSMSTMMMSTSGSSVFNEMIENHKELQGEYDILAGTWPDKYDEVLLVLPEKNGMPDILVYSLGLRSSDELSDMLAKIMAGEPVEDTGAALEFSYEELLGLPLKVVNPTEKYKYNAEYDIYEDMSSDKQFMQGVYDNALDLKIVGVVCAKDEGSSTGLTPGIAYTKELTEYVIRTAAESEIVKKQIANKEVNVFSGKRFDDKNEDAGLNFQDMITVDTEALSEAFGGSINQSDIESMTKGYMEEISAAITTDTSGAEATFKGTLATLARNLLNNYIEENKDPVLGVAKMQANQVEEVVATFMAKSFVQELLSDLETKYVVPKSAFENVYTQLLQGMLRGYISIASGGKESEGAGLTTEDADEKEAGAYFTAEVVTPLVEGYLEQEQILQVSETMARTMTEAVMQVQIMTKVGELTGKLMGTMADAFQVEPDKLAEAFQFNLSEEEVARLMATMSSGGVEKNADTNLVALGYQDFDKPSSISFYFRDFESKERFIDFLDDYNKTMEKEDEERVVKYTDLTGLLMSSVKTIVDSVSYVLIAFVSISLVVSSIMIGIITYISVLERTKEIGVLRAIGASKKNISSIFNAETFIVGLFAGLIGIGVTLALVPPINYVIHTLTGNTDINATLPTSGATVLVILSVILTLIGGLIPSKQAAKKDPVLALRSE